MEPQEELDANEYLRVSRDRSGRERSNTEQQDDSREAWPFRFQATYRDVGSASRYATRKRGDFAALLADLETGRFGAPMLVMWENSRGSRKVGEWVRLIDLCEQRQVRIAVTTHHRIYDPANHRDRRSLIDDANDAEYESNKTSERTRRSAARNAIAGRPSGRLTYGYKSVYDPSSGQLIGRVPHPEEAVVVVELFERIAKGHSFRAIATDFEQRGIRRRTGLAFTHQHLRSMALGEAYRAKRIHIPGRQGSRRPGDDVHLYDAQWEPLVPESLWLAVRAMLTDPARRTVRPGRAKHLLSFRAVCDVCDSPVAAVYRRGGRAYQCRAHHCVVLEADPLDAYARDAVLDYLAVRDNVARLISPDDDGRLEAARTEHARVLAERDDLYDQLGRGGLSAEAGARAEPAILARLAAAAATLQTLETPPVLRGLLEPGADVAQRWDDSPVSTRREVLRALFVPDLMGEMRIVRSPVTGRAAPVGDRVEWKKAAG